MARIAWHRLVLRLRQNLHWRHSGVYAAHGLAWTVIAPDGVAPTAEEERAVHAVHRNAFLEQFLLDMCEFRVACGEGIEVHGARGRKRTQRENSGNRDTGLNGCDEVNEDGDRDRYEKHEE